MSALFETDAARIALAQGLPTPTDAFSAKSRMAISALALWIWVASGIDERTSADIERSASIDRFLSGSRRSFPSQRVSGQPVAMLARRLVDFPTASTNNGTPA